MKCDTECAYQVDGECCRRTEYLLQAGCRDRTVMDVEEEWTVVEGEGW